MKIQIYDGDKMVSEVEFERGLIHLCDINGNMLTTKQMTINGTYIESCRMLTGLARVIHENFEKQVKEEKEK